MLDAPLEMDRVFKKFKRGEIHDSLRDLIPALTGGLLRRNRNGRLEQREFWALQDVSFQVTRGEAFGIIGANGAGKSTILKLLSNIMRPTKGALHVRGKLSALIEVSAGFHPDLTGRENIFLSGAILGMSQQVIRSKFDEIVAFSGLAEFIDTPVKRYSSGMFARLGFSVATHVEPDVLIVDEVLSVGDYVFQQKCIERMNVVLARGVTIVFVSHNLRAVADLCTRSLLLDRGRVMTIGPTDQVIKAYRAGTGGTRGYVADRDAFISRVTVRSEAGEGLEFESGAKAWVDVEVSANVPCDRLAVAIEFRDENQYEVFNTSTERIGLGTFAIEPTHTVRCSFELDLHLAQGTFHLGVTVYRYDISKTYDRWFPAATVFVRYDRDVRGVANLHPRAVVYAENGRSEPHRARE
jgi:ABC-type polysaccharide/polyol phosphate transport system ATPase subunit